MKPGLEVGQGQYRVILVHLPDDPDPLFEALPVAGTLHEDDLPLALRITDDRHQALQTAERMRELGAQVVIVEQWDQHGLFCHTHTGRIAGERCHVCGEPVCHACTLKAGGIPTCKQHMARKETRRKWTRIRQLGVMLLFSVFLYKVGEWAVDDYEKVQVASAIEVGVFQLVPDGHQYGTLIRGINELPSPEPYDGPTLSDMADWFAEEHERFTGSKGPYLKLRVHGPWTEDVDPPDLYAQNALLTTWRALAYVRYWRDLARARGVKPSSYPVELYINYDTRGDDFASHSRGSERQRLAIANVNLDERNPTYALITIAHELAHALGADDLYTEDATARFPEGYVEPTRDPLHPQRFAELMAVDIPTSRYGEREPVSMDEVRIGYHTAALMGWIEPSRAEFFYSLGHREPQDELPDEPGAEDTPPDDAPPEAEEVAPTSGD